MPPTASTPLSSTVNLINNVIGAGLFSMPWCLAQSTIVSGLVVFVLICLLNVYSFVLLARCCTLTGCYSYLDIGRLALGPRFGILAQATAILYACGSDSGVCTVHELRSRSSSSRSLGKIHTT